MKSFKFSVYSSIWIIIFNSLFLFLQDFRELIQGVKFLLYKVRIDTCTACGQLQALITDFYNGTTTKQQEIAFVTKFTFKGI